MNLLDFFKNFDLKKGFGTFFLGAISTGLAYLIQNPELFASIIPEKWATMTLVGLVIEGISYVQNLIKKHNEGSLEKA